MENIKNIRINTDGLRIDIKADRLNANLKEAADLLGERILMDCNKFIPKREGVLKNSGHLEPAGLSGEVVWNTPYAHYQHEGILYVGETTGSAWAKTGEHKVPAVSPKPFNYSSPGTGDHWFEKANEQYGQDWIKMVKERAGK